MIASPTQFQSVLKDALGPSLDDSELANWFTALQILEPPAGSLIDPTHPAGLYIVLAGKVRVLSVTEQLLLSLEAGDCFGGLPLLAGEAPDWRAGLNLRLGYLPSTQLRQLLKHHPQVADYLQQKAYDRAPNLYEAPAQPVPALRKFRRSVLPSLPTPLAANRQPLPTANQRRDKATTTRINHAYFPSPRVQVGRLFQRMTQQYPLILQQSSMDCGIACLAMIGRYWGKNFSINQLRALANVDRRGTSIKGLVLAAEAVGFSTRPIKASLDQLAQQNLPAVVHWEGQHYVVVYKITKTHVIMVDPAIGQTRMPHAQFLEGWTGYALIVQPTAQLQRAPEAKQVLWRFVTLLKPHWLILAEITLASLLLQVFGLISPIFTQLLLDRVVVQRSVGTLTAIGAGLLIVSVFQVVLSSLRQYLMFHTANRIDFALVVGFISHVLQLKLGFFETRYVGDITSRIAENQKIRSFITGGALTTILDLCTVFVYVGLMFWYSWQMALTALVMVPVMTLMALIAMPFLRRISREAFSASAKEESYLIETLTGIGTIKSMGIEQRVRWRWEKLFSNVIKINFSAAILQERLSFATGLVQTVISQALLLAGIWLVINDQLTIGQLTAFNMVMGNATSPFMRFIGLWDSFQEILISVERLNDVIDSPVEEDLQETPKLLLPPVQGHIRFENVCFRYNLENETNTLENVSFEVNPGQTVALVGRSGSGKTTLSKLLLGLYLPTEGKLWIDGYDLSTVALRSLRQQVGVVDQNTFLFGGTIKENLTIGHPNATITELKEAARLAGADQFIAALPMQYDTQIGEGGGMLSGGQRQRLAIARALLGRPRLLILDEATSSLDAETEQIIQTNLSGILKHQTTFIIAHRLSTIRHADLILVLDQGILIESGTHDELIAKRGQYYHLNRQQFTITAA
jgi:ATP-binding cassette subfamily B protein